ncbi:hypothetical protein LTR56_027026 [Elasticomyces elasticus]|nr:hypothetical protein LTR56_027026 [Elasticomyces elasticus]KAK3623600.1 hypothetical protein LTR22_024328 [Elasticomyces elasticus]KAK4917979.1 hypothetical protein LTR49_014254 [Elasticomyces elasticus]KAK5743921.1 hypothetical protein LTS12_023648 [Elasticomyces elasticus]
MHFNTAIITAAAAIFSSAASAVVLPPAAEVVFPNATVAGNTTSCCEECRSVREAYEADEGHANKTLSTALDSCLHSCEIRIKFGHMTLSEIFLEIMYHTDELRLELFESRLEKLRRELDFMEFAYGWMVRNHGCGLFHEKVSKALLDSKALPGISMAAEQLASVVNEAASATQPSDDPGVGAHDANEDMHVLAKEIADLIEEVTASIEENDSNVGEWKATL